MKSDKKQIHIFTDSFLPIDNTNAYYLNGVVDALSNENKYKINVYFVGEKKFFETKRKLNVRINKIYYPSFNKNNLIKRTINFLLISLIFSFLSLTRVKKGEIMLLTTNPPFMLLIISIIKKIKKFKMILLTYDIFPENTIAANILKEKSLAYKTLSKLFYLAYRNIDYFIAIGRDMESYLKKKYSLTETIFIPNWSNTDNIKFIPKQNNNLIDNKYIKKFIFQFSGNFGRVQEMKLIFDSIKLVNDDNIVFLFIGDGFMKNNLKEMIKNYPNKNILYLGRKNFNEQHKFLPISDVGIVSLNKEVNQFGVPSKSYAYLAAGRPLLFIGNNESEINKMIVENSVGWSTNTDSPKELAKLFQEISHELNLDTKRKAARKIAETIYSPNIIKNNYVTFFNNII